MLTPQRRCILVTPETIRKTFDENHEFLMKHGDYERAVEFAKATRSIAIEALPSEEVLPGGIIPECNMERDGVLEYLEGAILEAKIAEYNCEYDVALGVQPEEEDA